MGLSSLVQGHGLLELGMVAIADVGEVDVQSIAVRPGMDFEPAVEWCVVLLEDDRGPGLDRMLDSAARTRFPPASGKASMKLVPSTVVAGRAQESLSFGVDVGDRQIGIEREERIGHRLEDAGPPLPVRRARLRSASPAPVPGRPIGPRGRVVGAAPR